MAKKNVKVFIIKAKAASGNDRTVQSIVSLDVTLADVCKAENIPMPSISSSMETAPMTKREAFQYVANGFKALVTAPNTILVKNTCKIAVT